MKLKNLLIINAFVALIYGIGELALTETMMSLYGVTVNAGTLLMGRYFGAALLGIGLLTWLSRDVTDKKAQSAIVLSMLVYMVTGLIVSVYGTLSGVMSAMGWSAAIIFLFLALGYAYFQFVRPQESDPLTT